MKASNMTNYATYIACGMVLGSAIGTAAAVMMTSKKKKPEGLREKAVSTMDTVGSVMQSIAHMAK